MKIDSERIIERLNYRMDISKDLQGPLGDGYRLAVIQMLDVIKQEEIFAKEMQDLEELKAQLEKEGKI